MPATATLPREVLDLADGLLGEAPHIEFLDHGRTPNEDGWATLSEMADPERAGNNCHAATTECHTAIVEAIGFPTPDTDVLLTEVEYGTGVHWFLTVVTPNDGRWALDFTARQFDEDAAFPVIAPADEHLTWLNKIMAEKWQDTLVEVHQH